jgi:cell division protein FtsW
MYQKAVDRPLLIILILLIASGAIIFFSASLGLLGRGAENYQSILLKQYGFGLLGGSAVMYALSRVKYLLLRKHAYLFFIFGVVLTFLVFVPGIGMSHGGATRWIDLGLISFQPSEFLKIGTVIYIAAILASQRRRGTQSHLALVPILGAIGLSALALLLQPDIDTLGVVFIAVIAMYITATGKWFQAFAIGIIGLVALAIMAYLQPYVMSRITTLLNPSDFQGAGYQIKQSLIAVGSGGLTGRGFGQSVQKYDYLPEPIGDSIFAVYAEETGFIGASFLILLYLAFTLRGLTIASRVSDAFGGLLVVGIVILISAQSFINIAAMIGLLPLSGIPLVFVSHGGTALLIAMAQAGILLNVSRNATV